jgi:plastocyanin
MENDTLFYVLGGALTVLAVIVSFLGLRREDFPPSGAVATGVIAIFALLVAGTAVFAVASARDEQAHREAEEAEHAAEEGRAAEEEGTASEPEQPAGEPSGQPAGEEPAAGAATTLQLAADPTALAFDKPSLSAQPGTVTIELDNPAPVPHNVAIAKGEQVVAESETVSDSQTSVSADLEPGAYEFVCTVPGHEEAGMEGTLEVG